MLDFGGAGSGGQGNGRTVLIFSAIVAPSNCPSMPERAWVSSSSLVISVPNIVPPSCSMSPACLCCPSTLSFPRILPLDRPRALQQSMTISTPTVVVVVIIVVVCFASDSPSCTEMIVDIKSLDVIRTLGACGSCGRGRLTLMSMRVIVGTLRWGWATYSRLLWGVVRVVVTIDGRGVVFVLGGGRTSCSLI